MAAVCCSGSGKTHRLPVCRKCHDFVNALEKAEVGMDLLMIAVIDRMCLGMTSILYGSCGKKPRSYIV